MSIQIKEVTNKQELKAFVMFPLELYKDCKYFVPQLISQEMKPLIRILILLLRFAKQNFGLLTRKEKLLAGLPVLYISLLLKNGETDMLVLDGLI